MSKESHTILQEVALGASSYIVLALIVLFNFNVIPLLLISALIGTISIAYYAEDILDIFEGFLYFLDQSESRYAIYQQLVEAPLDNQQYYWYIDIEEKL